MPHRAPRKGTLRLDLGFHESPAAASWVRDFEKAPVFLSWEVERNGARVESWKPSESDYVGSAWGGAWCAIIMSYVDVDRSDECVVTVRVRRTTPGYEEVESWILLQYAP